MAAAPSLRHLLESGQAWRLGAEHAAPSTWTLSGLSGRYVELAAHGPAARLTLAGALVLEAQLARQPAAWITSPQSSFHPPDLAHNGVDLAALVVVRVPRTDAMLRAAEILLRAGAFALVVVDLESAQDRGDVALAAQTRLVGLAQHHGSLLLCLTCSDDRAPHSLASLRVEASLRPLPDQRFACELEAVKDKRAGPGWRAQVVCRGVPGLAV
ncbi:MAG: recombinase A [Planctomycetota bacterium]